MEGAGLVSLNQQPITTKGQATDGDSVRAKIVIFYRLSSKI